MRRRGMGAVIALLALLFVVWAPMWLFATVPAIIGLARLREYGQVAEARNLRLFRGAVYGFALLCFAVAGVFGMLPDPSTALLGTFFVVAACLMAAVAVFLLMAVCHQPLESWLSSAAASSFALFTIVLPLVAVISLRSGAWGWFNVVYFLIVLWAGGAFEWAATVVFSRQAASSIRNKTWVSAALSFVGAIVAGGAIIHFCPFIAEGLAKIHLLPTYSADIQHPPSRYIALLSGGINAAAQLGQLVESRIRQGGNSPPAVAPRSAINWVGRAGTLLFSAPVLWWYVLLYFSLNGPALPPLGP